MTVGPLGGVAGSVAGSPLAQRGAQDVERAQQEAIGRERAISADQQAETAAGIGTTDEDQEAGERDADGRRLWERPARAKPPATPEDVAPPMAPAKDVSGDCGNQLDVTG
jgi:hypothetical protein